ncbi:MAG: hypothetical protein J5864_08405, partial [Oscillospiraceae bacterium]|nr:hypothetical protein [Oscillospiraceae bacterium]
MSENKWLKRVAAFSAALLMLVPCAGCSGNSGSSGAGQNGSSVSDSTGKKKQKVKLTEEQKKAAGEAGISEERYCTDNTEITKTAGELLDQYCEGMMNADHDKCFDAFPSFYKKAVEDENKKYGETNEQFMQGIKTNFSDSYGDDFYIYATVNSVLQLSDESLENTEKRLKKSFDDGIVLEDLFYVYFTDNVRGSQNKSSDSL